MYKKILLAYDFNENSQNALEWAIKWGGQYHSTLYVVSILPKLHHAKMEELLENSESFLTAARHAVDESVRKIQGLNNSTQLRDINIRIDWGDPETELFNEIEKINPDIIFMGAHDKKSLKHVLLGSLSEKLMRHSKIPVFLARGPAHLPLKNIMLPLDLQGGNDSDLFEALQFAQSHDAAIDLVHVVTPSDFYAQFPGFDYPPLVVDITNELKENAEKQLANMALEHDQKKLQTQVLVGPPAESICEYAVEKSIDLIFMPSHHDRGFEHFLRDHLSEQVLRYAPCSVLSFSKNKS